MRESTTHRPTRPETPAHHNPERPDPAHPIARELTAQGATDDNPEQRGSHAGVGDHARPRVDHAPVNSSRDLRSEAGASHPAHPHVHQLTAHRPTHHQPTTPTSQRKPPAQPAARESTTHRSTDHETVCGGEADCCLQVDPGAAQCGLHQAVGVDAGAAEVGSFQAGAE